MPSLKLPKLPRRRPGSPSLKDRAAALKASAARVMRRGETVASHQATADVTASPKASAPCPVGPRDAGLVTLGYRFDGMHAEWLRTVEANRAPQALRQTVTRAGKAHGLPYETAESIACSLPGVEEACDAEQAAFEALEPVMRSIFAQPAHTLAGLAVKARATIPAMWMGGNFEEDAADPNQEWEKRAVSQFIQAACAAAGVDWRGQPVSGQALPSAAASLADQILAGWREYGTDVGMSCHQLRRPGG